MTNFIIDFENLSDKDLYQYCKTIGFNARKWHRRFIATIPEVAKRRLYKKYGYCSVHEFAAKMAGVSHENVDVTLRVNEKFRELPKMKALIGEVGLSKLKVVAYIATKDTDSFWAEKVKNMTKSSLEIYVKEIKRKDIVVENHNFSQKFPGELNVENYKNPQQQEQINMFDFEKIMSQNSNSARVEKTQNHDKRTFTIQIDEKVEFELRKFKQLLEKERKEPIDWNLTLKEMVKRVTICVSSDKKNKKTARQKTLNNKIVKLQTTKSTPASESRTKPISRYIPASTKRDLEKKHQGHCAYSGCNKTAEQIHHQNRFALKHNHDKIIPLCKNHHAFIHQSTSDPCKKAIDNIINKFKTEKFAASGI